MNPISDHVLSFDGIPIHYEVRGDGELALVLFMDGAVIAAIGGDKLAPFLSSIR